MINVTEQTELQDSIFRIQSKKERRQHTADIKKSLWT